jgi:hypothetical protein
MADVSEEQFRQMSPEQRQDTLKEMRVEVKFRRLPDQDRQEVLNVLRSVQQQPDVGQLEAGARGFAQGVTFGFSDEAIAGLSAGIQSLFKDRDFKELYNIEVQKERAKDVSAEAQHPGTFGAGEVAGALGTLAIPVAGVAGRVGQAAKGARFAGRALGGTPTVAGAVAPSVVGKGLGRGLAGVAKGAGAGALTTAGKSEERFGSESFGTEVTDAALTSGGVQGVINAAGPAARGLGKLVVKHRGAIARGVGISKLGFVGAKLSGDALGGMKKAVGDKFPELGAKLDRIKAAGKKAGEKAGKFGNILVEAFEKQGGEELIRTHIELLQDPRYREFLKE